jgi:hypothetical protein
VPLTTSVRSRWATIPGAPARPRAGPR